MSNISAASPGTDQDNYTKHSFGYGQPTQRKQYKGNSQKNDGENREE